ncbi:DUF4352 domain-containing protein [Tumebacillus permanentifrigoris]|uniref:Uncharacterized protein DUF4352 n=1 Tax=Tumebacillus permanentifrigoris TaxID=378543 RepID=A0A316D378_9BACL|nr:DUF4352 domain-containing protein [Tumebacillus permanentifrigoris]PWK05290.1 uncharacterized protein DUF4352 [Tumebacillus permanentifrigoris]
MKCKVLLVALICIPMLVGCESTSSKNIMETYADDQKRAQEVDYREAMAMWKDTAKRNDLDYIMQVGRKISNSNKAVHPDAREVEEQVRVTVTDLAVKKIIDDLDKGEVHSADITLLSAKTYGYKDDPRLVELKAKIDPMLKELELVDNQKRAQEQAEKDSAEKAKAATATNYTQSPADKMRQYEKITGTVGLAVTGVQFEEKMDGFSSKDGSHHFLLISVSTKNDGSGTASVNPLYFTLVADGTAYPPNEQTYGMNGYFSSVDLPAGTDHKGWLCFFIPKSSRNVDIVYNNLIGDQATKHINLP